MEPTASVLGAQHKQWSRENKQVSHNWKKGLGRLNLNQLSLCCATVNYINVNGPHAIKPEYCSFTDI
ncbi:hypothetical protein HOLleu_26942 [Holothuria leucospilota]|uniref:Uncharacterized protein n=1 Tax=Holothuria leucospilota TaxID=206669 RepID=A0A9Q1BQ30_HOLLE|nr:hypothetical protein HOLleu_26942 [Holothuria leucospilota]